MSTDINRTTEFVYNADGNLTALIARNAQTGDQVTRWHYGTTLADSGVASNSLLRAKMDPDSDDPDAATPGPDELSDRMEYSYNRRGEVVQRADQNGTVHHLVRDGLGRAIEDRVTALGIGVDGAIRRISFRYDLLGNATQVQSWNAAEAGQGAVVNEVMLRYNGFGQLTHDYQEHGGAVATASSPVVSYDYADGSNRHIRRLATHYPGGREIAYHYGASGSSDAALGRIHEIRDETTSPGEVMARYTRRGLSATMRIEYPQAGPANPLELTYIKQAGEPNGPAGDQYTGQDRFDRIIDIRWLRSGTSTHVDRIQYGFDRAGNRLWRKNVVAASNWDELYAYDGLYQLGERQRGTLNGGNTGLTSTPLDQEEFTFDPTGNWDNYATQANGNPTLSQIRTHNEANEITGIDGSGTAIGYDAAGNTTAMPKVGNWAIGQSLIWDAWSCLVKVKQGATTIAEFTYDGLSRRAWKQTMSGGGPARRHYYYSDQGQILEERIDGSNDPDRTFVWGDRYQDDLIARDRGSGPTTTERLYATHDQWHVISIVRTDAVPAERFAYRAFGETQVLNAAFSPLSGDAKDWEVTYGAYRFDPETGTYLAIHRYLHPSLGRWLSRDPLSVNAGTNLYRYVQNRPTGFADPTGLKEGEGERCSRVVNCTVMMFTGQTICVPGQGGVGGKIPGTASNTQNCAGASLGINEWINWPGVGREGDDAERASKHMPQGCRTKEPDKNCKCDEKEVVVWIWSRFHPTKKKELTEFHMVGRGGCSNGPYNSKGGSQEEYGGITDPFGHFMDRFNAPQAKEVCLCCDPKKVKLSGKPGDDRLLE